MTHHIQLFTDRSGAGINWRLLAPNNRETARGTRLHADEHACRDDVLRLQSAAGRLRPRARRAAQGRWSWELSLDGTVVVAATNSFDRQIRCEQALDGIAERFASARIASSLTDTVGRRRAPRWIIPAPSVRENA